MSDALIYLLAGYVGFLSSLLWILRYSHRAVKGADCNLGLLGLRLEHYAVMKGRSGGKFSGGLLKPEQHEILLGVLKKIEAKNAVMASITLFFVTVLIRELLSGVSGPLSRVLVFAVVGGLLGTVLARLEGARHLDQTDFIAIHNAHCDDFPAQRREMQHALMRDLLRKEAQFRATIPVIVVSMVCLALSLVLQIPQVADLLGQLIDVKNGGLSHTGLR